jgi:hypothetical protein
VIIDDKQAAEAVQSLIDKEEENRSSPRLIMRRQTSDGRVYQSVIG